LLGIELLKKELKTSNIKANELEQFAVNFIAASE